MMQTPLATLECIPKLKWTSGPNTPISSSYPLQAVRIDDDIFVENTRLVISRYSVHSGSWKENLPGYNYMFFRMVAMNNRLVLIGGTTQLDYKAVDKMGVFEEGLRKWDYQLLPKLPTPRFQVSAVAYGKWLVVAGGRINYNDPNFVSIVEILNTTSKQWYKAAPLPSTSSAMSSAINGNMWYLLGGFISKSEPSRNVFCVCLDELTSQAESGESTTASPWQILPRTPLERSCAVILDGALLSIGGSCSSLIYRYHPEGKIWFDFANLCTPRSQCACVALPDGRLFVAGGLEGEVATNRLDIASFNYS